MSSKPKPWYRWRNVTIAAVLAFLLPFGWALLEVLEVYRAAPNPTVDTRAEMQRLFEASAAVHTEDATKAWALLSTIFEAFEAATAEVRDVELDFSCVYEGGTPAEAPEPERLAIGLLRERGVFDRLGEFAAGVPGFQEPPGDGPLDISLLDWLSAARHLAQARVASMRLAAAEGDQIEAAAALDQTLALARTVAWQPYVLCHLTGTVIEAVALAELRFELLELDLEESSGRPLLDALDRHETFPPVSYSLAGERLYFRDWMQWTYSDDGQGDGYLVAPLMWDLAAPRRPSLPGAAVARFLRASRAETSAVHGDLMDRLIAITKRVPAERPPLLRAESRVADDLPGRHIALRQMIGALDRFVLGDAGYAVRREGTRVMVGLAMFRARHGAYPDSLDELAPEILAAPPVDPLHGLPFGYRTLSEDPDGRPYLLYSFGLDRRDDGGRELADDRAAVLDPDAPNADWVISRTRASTYDDR